MNCKRKKDSAKKRANNFVFDKFSPLLFFKIPNKGKNYTSLNKHNIHHERCFCKQIILESEIVIIKKQILNIRKIKLILINFRINKEINVFIKKSKDTVRFFLCIS